MRRTASEKLEIIRLVEDSELSVRQTLREIKCPPEHVLRLVRSVPRSWNERPRTTERRSSRQWNRVPKRVRDAVVQMALEQTELSPRELAWRYTDENRYFVSESTVYRILKAQDLITSPAYVLLEASDRFRHPSVRVHELWQTDFTYLHVVGWGWYYWSAPQKLAQTKLDEVA